MHGMSQQTCLEAFRSKYSLKRHLKGSVHYECNPGGPRKARILRQAQLNVLKLHWPAPTKQRNVPFLTASVADVDN
jgi:hypothetical protein